MFGTITSDGPMLYPPVIRPATAENLRSEPSGDSRANQINREHRLVGKANLNSVLHARHCGELLNEVKKDTTHGKWGKWLDDNFDGSETTAAGYMRIADG